MFEFIIGKIVNIKDDYIVIQNNGIGYKVFSSYNTIASLEVGKDNQLLYTQLHVREDGVFIFGFSSEEEMEMFNLLLLVSKVGPKIAIGVLSTLSSNKIKLAILDKNITELCKAPGIGKKTAERIIVELRDRIDRNTLSDQVEETIIKNDSEEAILALISLGYNRYEVERAILSLDTNGLSLEEIIKGGLKALSKN